MDFKLLDNILDSIWVFNSDRELIYFNGATAALLDVSPKRITNGKKVHELLSFQDSDVFFMPDGVKGKNKEMKLTEIPFKTFKGKEGIALVSIRKLSANENYWICQIRDISLEVNLHAKYHVKLREMEEVNHKLESYNKNLEKMVEERTRDLKKANHFLEAMMNGLGQGLVVFDENLKCNPNYTKICNELFYKSPADANIADLLSVKDLSSFSKWADILFKNMIPFKDAAKLGPQSLNKDGKHVTLEYHLLQEDGDVHGVMVVATDKTEEFLAKEELEVKKSYVEMVTAILHRRKQFHIFRNEFKIGMRYIQDLIRSNCHNFDEAKLKITLHSLKGTSLSFHMKNLGDKLHEIEEYLSNTSIREPEAMIALFEELDVIYKHSFKIAAELLGEDISDDNGAENRVFKLNELETFRDYLYSSNAKILAKEFHDQFIKEPLSSYFQGLNEFIEGLALELNKRIAPLQFEGVDLKLDTKSYDEFFNALTHLFRNCVYHGIEKPEERVAKSKSSEGKIKIKVEKDDHDEFFVLKISDDGAGVNIVKLREKLMDIGVQGAENMESQMVALSIFDPDISTSESVNKISGRGIGMYALKVAVDNLNGKLSIETEKDKGTEFIFKIPLVS